MRQMWHTAQRHPPFPSSLLPPPVMPPPSSPSIAVPAEKARKKKRIPRLTTQDTRRPTPDRPHSPQQKKRTRSHRLIPYPPDTATPSPPARPRPHSCDTATQHPPPLARAAALRRHSAGRRVPSDRVSPPRPHRPGPVDPPANHPHASCWFARVQLSDRQQHDALHATPPHPTARSIPASADPQSASTVRNRLRPPFACRAPPLTIHVDR